MAMTDVIKKFSRIAQGRHILKTMTDEEKAIKKEFVERAEKLYDLTRMSAYTDIYEKEILDGIRAEFERIYLTSPTRDEEKILALHQGAVIQKIKDRIQKYFDKAIKYKEELKRDERNQNGR